MISALRGKSRRDLYVNKLKLINMENRFTYFAFLLIFGCSMAWQPLWAQPGNDLCAGAIPITPSAEGTGCGTPTFNLPFSTDGTTDSGVPTVCSTPGLDHWFTWTATTAGLTFSSESPGNPGIAIFANCADAAAGERYRLPGYFQQRHAHRLNISDALIIQIYDFSGSVSDVAFLLGRIYASLAARQR